MDEKEAALRARLSLHEGILLQLWAQLLLSDPDPLSRTTEMMERSLAAFARTWADSPESRADAPELTLHLRALAQGFWLKVQQEVENAVQG